MTKTPTRTKPNGNLVRKAPTGNKGLDEITQGGLPRDRITLLSGGPGAGKTLFGLDFLIRGATLFKENGVFMSFEETEAELHGDVASMHVDLKGLVARKKIWIENVSLDRRETPPRAEFDLEGIFVRLEHAIHAVGAKRVVLDSIESLFAGVSDADLLRIAIKRLFHWLKQKQVTSIVIGEMGAQSFTRHGLEQNIADCVIFLDNRVANELTIRRIRIIKYRGSWHGTNEYPFVINDDGISVIPITSAGLNQPGTRKRVSTGIPELDAMLHGGGYTRGSTVLVSGTAGTGKTTLAVAFALASCKRGERCLFLSYEESAGQLVQNMKSIGVNLVPYVKSGLLRISATRPSFFGLENHLLDLYQALESFKPDCVVLDPLTSLLGRGQPNEIESMITRMIDLLKSRGITGFFTSLVPSSADRDSSGEIGVSSLIDTWIVVRELEEDVGLKRIRGLYIVKSRGMGHSSDVHKLILSNTGIKILPTEIGTNRSKLASKKSGAHRPKRAL